MSGIDATKVWLDNFYTSSYAAQISKELLHKLGFEHHYQLARLALGRSLGEKTVPEKAPDAKGTSIRGNILFGDEQSGGLLWLSLLIESFSSYSNDVLTNDKFKDVVRDHWCRGISLLQQDWEEAGDYSKFVELLITCRAALPSDSEFVIPDSNSENQHKILTGKPVTLDLGHDKNSDEPIKWLVNGQGYSPNVAIMGQAGSGKTRMMLKLLRQLRELTNVPVLLIDAGKDELAERIDLAEMLNATVLKVPNQAMPLDIFYGSTVSAESARDVTIAFRESLDKALEKGLTDNQKMRVLESLRPLFAIRKNITMVDIKTAIEGYYEENYIRQDRVVTIPNELCQYQLFDPVLPPEEFFKKSWIFTFGSAPTESRKLAMFLLFDALYRYFQSLPEAPMDSENHRAIRLAVAVDEARPLLDAKHDGLSKMVRLLRSKGLTVFMASQSPDDYAGQNDDYMEQIGLPICFKTNAISTAVLNNMFKSKPNFSALETGTCLTVIENVTRKVRAF